MRLPASIQMPTVAVSCPVSSDAIRSPFGSVVTFVSGIISIA